MDEAQIGQVLFTLILNAARLAVSRDLVEANGGRLTVSSRPGQGAAFSLVLPARETAGS